MNIALDFDQCYTMDVNLWDAFINIAQDIDGHVVYIVTSRYADGEKIPWSPVPPQRVIYTNRKAKRPFVQQHLGIHIDIWIDDSPEYIDHDHGNLLKWTKEEQAEYTGEDYQQLLQRAKQDEINRSS